MSAQQNAELITNTWKNIIAGKAEEAAANMSDESVGSSRAA